MSRCIGVPHKLVSKSLYLVVTGVELLFCYSVE